MSNKNAMPCLEGAIVLVFPATTHIPLLNEVLPHGACCTRYSDCIESILVEVNNFYSWEINDLLTHLFMQCDLTRIQELVATYHANVLIDISFHHYDTYPALVFEGKNMEIIHNLRANISIDPY